MYTSLAGWQEYLLKKKYHLDVICLKKDNLETKEKNLIAFKDPNIFLKCIYCIVSIFKLEPVQFGLFFSNDIKKFLINNANNYDYLFFLKKYQNLYASHQQRKSNHY